MKLGLYHLRVYLKLLRLAEGALSNEIDPKIISKSFESARLTLLKSFDLELNRQDFHGKNS